MQEHAQAVVAALESDPGISSQRKALAGLRRLDLDDFGELLLSMPSPKFPRLSGLLPAMASEEVQRHWTGNHGLPLLRQSTAFVRALSHHFTRLNGRPLQGAKVLDFGCGYGRIARLMSYFTDEENLFGVDPWDRSIQLCLEARLPGTFRISEYLPESLPVGDMKFDLIIAFSVFTHLSRRACAAALGALRKHAAGGGVLAMTVRPGEYWLHDPNTTPEQQAAFSALHRSEGFAFHPLSQVAVDGDITYGDTSMTLEWLERTFVDWAILESDLSAEDPLQRYVFLTPREGARGRSPTGPDAATGGPTLDLAAT